MTQLISRTGEQSQQFNTYDSILEYPQYSMISYLGNIYQSNDLIPASTAFATGSTGATWSLKIIGGNTITSVTNGSSNITLDANANIGFSSNSVANMMLMSASTLVNSSYTSVGISGSGTNTIILSSVEQLVVGQIIEEPTYLPAATTITAITGKTITVSDNLLLSAPDNTTFTIGISPSLVEFKGNIVVSGHSNLGYIDGITILGGNTGQLLSTDGSGFLSWANGGSGTGTSLVNGNSNVVVAANANITLSSNGQANIFNISSNGTFANTTIANNVTITGNLSVQGTTTTNDVQTQNIIDPIINLGINSNNSVLIANDGKDRGVAMHTYNTGNTYTVVGAVNANVDSIVLNSVSGITVGMLVGSPTTANLFVAGTTVATIDAPNVKITITPNTANAITDTTSLAIGTDFIRLMSWDVGNSEFSMSSNTTIDANNNVTINTLGNLRIDNLIANIRRGNSNIVIVENGNIAFSSGGTSNVFIVTANGVSITGNLTISGNVTTSDEFNGTLNGGTA
jgi:hypothetical protein